MFFYVAKTLGVFVQGTNLLFVLLIAGVALMWTRRRRTGRIVATLATVALALVSFTPIGTLIVRPLEDRFPQATLAEPPTGIIVLGGAMDEAITRLRGQFALNDAAERLTVPVALARRYPQARLVFSGGSGRLRPDEMSESDVARDFWLSMGVAAERMSFEDMSRDTYENVAFTKEIVKPKPGERWLLVTSAMHMPRSVGIFRKLDFPVIPYPVDYRTTGTSADFVGLRQPGGAIPVFDAAAHEWIGLVAYWATGKTAALFPAP
ncbi:MAG: YdcF family protein [Beijerinckiaceae bacterium]